MLRLHTVARFGLTLALLSPLPFASACGGSQKSVDSLPKAESMPEFGDWTGVFFSPTYGYLHLIREGDTVSGKWRTTSGDKWGQMHGPVTGDLFKYDWEETTIGMVGPSATRHGHGFFKYVKAENDEIRGEWGLDDDYRGVTWSAVKQARMKPDPNSVVPDETQRVRGDSWDQDKKVKKNSDSDSDKSDDWN